MKEVGECLRGDVSRRQERVMMLNPVMVIVLVCGSGDPEVDEGVFGDNPSSFLDGSEMCPKQISGIRAVKLAAPGLIIVILVFAALNWKRATR
jgi:hypothetical protein